MASAATDSQAVNGLSKKLEQVSGFVFCRLHRLTPTQLQASTPNGNGSLSRNGSDSNINRIRKDTM